MNRILLAVILNLTCLVNAALSGDIKGTVFSEWLQSKKDVLIFIEVVDSNKVFEIPKGNPKMDQQNLTFIPHVLPVVAGTTIDFPNSDKVQHNVFSPSKPQKFDLGSYPPGEFKSIKFDTPGKVAVLCNVHPEMSAYIIVLQNPFFALTDNDGKYLISNVPSGKYRLSTWHKNLETATIEVNVPADGAVEINFESTIGKPANLLKLFN